jgi:hypothetical protein
MRALSLLLAALAGACVIAGLVWWFGPGPLVRDRPAPPTVAPAPAPVAPPSQPTPAAPLLPPAPVAAVEVEPKAAPAAAPRTGDLAIYDRKPMSEVPHQVSRAWGLSDDPGQRKLIGAYLIVDSGISDAELMKLGRDLIDYHRDAKILAVRVYDSEQAASYDRERDGGKLADDHLVARIVNDSVRKQRGMYIRGKWVEL